MRNPAVRQLAAAALTLSIAATPALALAQSASSTTGSVSSIRAQIEALMKQMETLKAQLKLAERASVASTSPIKVGTTTPPGLLRACPVPIRNLGRGSSGDDVKELQNFLTATDPTLLPPTAVTGFFGPMTAEAVKKFQEKHGIATSTTGFVGPITRDFFGKKCGEILGQKKGQNLQEDRKGPNKGPEPRLKPEDSPHAEVEDD